jgi:predicted RNA-binding protein YlxR (DUF448 family)
MAKAKKKTAKKAVKSAKSSKTAKVSKASKSTNPGRASWTDADIKGLKTYVKQNTPTRLIAMKLKRSVASVYAKAAKEGISLAPANRSTRD